MDGFRKKESGKGCYKVFGCFCLLYLLIYFFRGGINKGRKKRGKVFF